MKSRRRFWTWWWLRWPFYLWRQIRWWKFQIGSSWSRLGWHGQYWTQHQWISILYYGMLIQFLGRYNVLCRLPTSRSYSDPISHNNEWKTALALLFCFCFHLHLCSDFGSDFGSDRISVWISIWISVRISFPIPVRISVWIFVRFWQSYFIKLFGGGLQCEFIRTFIYENPIHFLNKELVILIIPT